MRKTVRRIDRSQPWHYLSGLADWVLDTAIAIQQIPAPTFAEQRRADFVAQQYVKFGLEHIDIDDALNVYGLLPGTRRNAPGVMISAHTDTVFSADTDLSIGRDGDAMHGPGLGDNSMGVAGMLGLLHWLRERNITPDCDLWFVATSCEEGLGDLKGIRAAYRRLRDRIAMGVNIEGLAYGHVYHAGIAVHRLQIKAKSEGGHSWTHYGRPSAIHALMRLGAEISQIKTPESPRTTYNIGVIDGGRSINAIATDASLWLDLRSEAQSELDRLRHQVQTLIDAAQQASDGITFEVEVVGDRPSGTLSVNHPLVQGALETLDILQTPGALEKGSTDANILLADGCPAVTVGITRGGNAHRLDEYIQVTPIAAGMRQLIVLTLAATHYQAVILEAAGD